MDEGRACKNALAIVRRKKSTGGFSEWMSTVKGDNWLSLLGAEGIGNFPWRICMKSRL